MKNKLEIQKFIREHDDWIDVLSSAPYCLEIKHDNIFDRNLVLFKYNMIGSDFSNEIVRESRGLVLDADTFEPIVVPFFKFFNSQEIYADKIDWNTAKVTQKLDGSIVKVVKMGPNDLLIGTNSNIDAFKAPLAEQLGCNAKTFGDLFLEGLAYYGLNAEMLATILEYDKTYIFELTSPYNQVVVRFNETKVNLIGIRDNKTLIEEKFEDSHLADVFNTPKIYDLKNEADCIAAASELPDSEEGYVVRDDEFRRVKIKSPRYLELHRLAGNHVLSLERALEIVKSGEIDEVVSYFPDFKNCLEEVKTKYDMYLADIDKDICMFWNMNNDDAFYGWSRKDFAKFFFEKFKVPTVGFMLLDNKIVNAHDWAKTVVTKKMIELMGMK